MQKKTPNPKDRVTRTVILDDLDDLQKQARKRRKLNVVERFAVGSAIIFACCLSIVLLVYVITRIIN